MGSDGLAPSPARVRTECAAANTLIPRLSVLLSPIGPEGVEPSSGSYKEPALTVELQAVRLDQPHFPVGPEGFEPSPARLKVCCAAVTPRPRNSSRGVRFNRCAVMSVLPSFTSNGPRWSRTTAAALSERHASVTTPGLTIGVARIELRCLVLPTHAGHHYPSPRNKSERPDSNRRSPGPRPGGFPGSPTF